MGLDVREATLEFSRPPRARSHQEAAAGVEPTSVKYAVEHGNATGPFDILSAERRPRRMGPLLPA
jgi:hypothetical protein